MPDTPPPSPPPVSSPCTGVCRMDAARGCCAGCLRTLDEIAAWSTLDDAGRRQVLQRITWRTLPSPQG